MKFTCFDVSSPIGKLKALLTTVLLMLIFLPLNEKLKIILCFFTVCFSGHFYLHLKLQNIMTKLLHFMKSFENDYDKGS